MVWSYGGNFLYLKLLSWSRKKTTFDPSTLKDFPFFASFSLEQLQGIFGMWLRVFLLKADQVVLKQGEVCWCNIFNFERRRKDRGGDSAGTIYLLGEMGKGQVFGELALLRNEPSRVTVTTTMDSDLLVIDRAMILNMMRTVDPEQVLDIFLALNEQTRAATERGFQRGSGKADTWLHKWKRKNSVH